MAIGKGEDWGAPGTLPPSAPVAASDVAVAGLVASHHDVIGVEGGDLARTLGARAPYDRSTPKQLLPVDAIEIGLDDGRNRICVAHAVVGNLLLSPVSIAVMNAAFIGGRNVAPRGHPGDGKVDVVTFDLSVGDRVKAWRRMTGGTHVPHPGISVRKRSEGVLEFGRRRPIRIDGELVGKSSMLRFVVITDAIVIAV